jgi:tetratricopeptide (TPR) repeat protein
MDDVSQTGGPHQSFGAPFERGRRRGAGCARPDLDAKDDGELARVEELVAEGRLDEADALLKRRSEGSTPSASLDYAAFLLDRGRVEEAMGLQDRAVKLRLEYGDEWVLAETYRPLDLASAGTPDDHADPSALDEALEAGERKGDPDRIADIHLGMGLAYARLGEWNRAVRSLRKALDIDERLATHERIVVARAVLTRALEAGGDSERADV